MVAVFMFCPAETGDWKEPSMHGKLSRLQDLPHSNDDENVSSPRDSVTSTYPCSALHAVYNAQIGSTNAFSATKKLCLWQNHRNSSSEEWTVTQRREGLSPTGFLKGTAIVQSASGLRSLTDGCSETRTLYRWWIHSLWDQWWAGWQPNMVADSKSLYYPHTPCYHDIFLFGKGKGI